MNIKDALSHIISGKDLSQQAMQAVMKQIMTGQLADAQIGGFLVGLATKGETVSEIVGAAKVMRQLATPIKLKSMQYLVDTCGTGGDGLGLFNISTAAAFVAAAAGAKVAKHGNRSISSKSGSADVLEIAGTNLNVNPKQVVESIQKIGVGFMFAQTHHSAMRYAIGVRKSLAIRTIFNILGPLTNPAGTPNQVLGVYNKDLLKPIAQALQALGSRHVMVVHSQDGLDEISINAPTDVAELKNNEIHYYQISPENFGIKQQALQSIKANNAQESLTLIQSALDGKSGGAKDIVALNAGAAIYVSGIEDSLSAGIKTAQRVLDSGYAHQKFDQFIQESMGCLS